MVVSNLQIGLLSTNGIFFTSSKPNSSIHEVSIFQKPNFYLVPGYLGVRKSSVFFFRKLKFGFINALPAEEIETYSTSSRLLEKEFNFSPTFDEYVKVLESVKTDRSRIINENGNFLTTKKKFVSVSKAESVREKANLSKSKKHWSKDKFYSEENYRESEYAKQNPPNAKNDVAEKSGYSWAVVERILKKKVKEKSAEQWRGRLERVSENLNSAKSVRTCLYKKTKGAEKKSNNDIFEKKRTSQRPEEQKENWLKLKRLNKLEGSKVVMSEIEGSDYGKPQFTPHFKDLNDQRNGLHKKIDGAEKAVDDEFLENEIMSEQRVQYTKKYQKDLNLKEMKNNNNIRGESNYRDYEKSNHSRRFRYGGYNDDIMFSNFEGSNFTEIFGKYESSSTFDNMNAKEKPRRSKMEALRMEGNRHNLAINALNSDLYVPTTENYQKNINRTNAKFNGSVGDEKLNSRSLITSGRSARTDVAYPYFSGGEMDGDRLEDRAAFKTFEVFTDVRNRPRVLRMELEERIQNLAKWLNASDLNMPEWQFSKMIHSAKIKFSEHSILRIVQILGSFGNWRRALQVIEWFHSRERFKYYKSRYIYTTALDVLGKAKRPMEALNIFYAMRQELSSYPDLAAYHCIAVTLGQAGLMKELFDVIDCMRTAPAKKFDLGPLQKWDPCLNPDIVVYNAVLNACVQQKQWEGAFWVLQELKGRGIRPSTTTYGLIMEVMLECGKYNLVYEFFWKLQKNSIPGALNYKVLLNTLWREGKVEEAVQAVKDMERRGIVGCASLYYDLARCLCSSGRCEEALHQINKICKVAKKPLVVTYTGLIQACLDSGSIENATYIFNQMKSFCSPNVITCNIMLNAYVQHGMFDDAKILFEKILSDSHQISKKDESYQKVLPDKFTFNTMLVACIAASKWDDFVNFYQEMIHHGYHFDERRHMRLVFDTWRAGKKNILEITWNHLTGNGRPPPPAMIKELFCMKMEEDEPAAAISFITVHQDMEIEAFSEKSWLRLLKRKVQHISIKTLARLLHELRRIVSESARPHPVYQNLLNACEEFASRSGGSCNPELISK